MCIECGSIHSTHNIIYFGKIFPNKDNLNNVLNEMKNNIDKFKSELNNVINRINYVIDIADNYYKLVKGIYDSLKIEKKNYEITFNINNINNNDFMNDIQNIINDNHIQNKLIKVNILYDKMTNNCKNNFYNSTSFYKDFYLEEDTKSILQREFNNLKENPREEIGHVFIFINDIMLVNNNLFEWVFSLNGPEFSPYYGGKFYLKIFFPDNYPKGRPEIRFVTPIVHCRVNDIMQYGDEIDPLGHLCTLIVNNWEPKNTIREVIIYIYSLFFTQDPCCSLEKMDLYKNNRLQFIERIKYFTKKYANPSFPYKEYDSWDFSYTIK
jgi:ubiquitin-conjugating enzyme E2 D/E